MIDVWRVYIALCMVGVLVACGGKEDGVEKEDVSTGNTSFEQSEGYAYYEQEGCIACHGDALQGASGPALTSQSLSVSEIEQIISKGKGFMPPQQVDADILTVLATWLSEQ
ncbi:cytochrome c [Bacillus sp. FSL W7-1360]